MPMSHWTDREAGPPRRTAQILRPLLVTADDQLLDDLLRLAAAAGIEVEVARDCGSARSRWPTVPLVVVGDDQADQLAALAPTRRRDVILVGRDLDDPQVWRRGVALGAEQVLFFPADESWLADRFADVAEGEDGQALVVGVIGGRGGAGASVLATALSITGSRRGLTVMLVDLDPLGGGLDLVLGAEQAVGLRWPDLADTRGRLGARALQAELPDQHGLSVVSCDRGDLLTIPAQAAAAVLSAARRACDVVVLDLPRCLDAAAEEAAGACANVLIVVPIEVRAVAAAGRVAARLTTIAADVRVVARGPSSSGLGGQDVAEALGLPLAMEMEAEPKLLKHLDRGSAPGLDHKGPLARGCAQILDALLLEHQVHAA